MYFYPVGVDGGLVGTIEPVSLANLGICPLSKMSKLFSAPAQIELAHLAQDSCILSIRDNLITAGGYSSRE